MQSLKRYLPVSPNRPASDWIPDKYFHEKEVEYNPYSLLSSDRKTAMRMMSDIEAIAKGAAKGNAYDSYEAMIEAISLMAPEEGLEKAVALLKETIIRKAKPVGMRWA